MLAELATYALCLALALSLLQAAALRSARLTKLIAPAATLSCLLISSAFILLIILRLDADFSVRNVAEHSNRALPLLYQITGTWGNHEGSILLFTLILSLVGAMLGQQRKACAIQGLLTAGMLLFLLTSSNPFARVFPPPAEGNMLNPLLQDIALAFHPPMLYLGYVGFSGVFSLAMAALIQGNIDRDWATIAHPWIIGAWSALTCGVALGSWWAYRELGWGGYWFWDPVENASLMPWLAGTSLLHANLLLKKRGMLASWVCLLAILTFGLSLIGTFLVRSGAITSVHSFASDPQRGLYMLLYLTLVMGSALWLYGRRVPHASNETWHLLSRDTAIVLQNLCFMTACATVLLGTLYPMALELLAGEQLSIGAPYFNRTVLPLLALSVGMAAFSAILRWQRNLWQEVLARSKFIGGMLVLTVILVLAMVRQEALLAACGLGLSGMLMAGSMPWLAGGKWRSLHHWPVFLAHAGAAILALGITASSLWGQQSEANLRVGTHLSIAGFTAQLDATMDEATANYQAERSQITLRHAGKEIGRLTPEYRRYAIRNISTSEAAIYSTAAYDILAVTGARDEAGRVPLRLYYKPSMFCLWLGAGSMTLGGILSLYRRLRKART